jgi:hypothetical protein
MTNKNTLINWRVILKLSATFLLSALAITSCKKEESQIGNDINPNGLNIVTQDTFTVKTYSSEIDSLETDETSVSLLGAYNDPEFGLVDCGVVTQIRLSSEGPNFGDLNDITVDSVVLSFAYTSIKFYANIEDLEFEVYRISDDLLRDDQVYYGFTPVTTTGASLIQAGAEIHKPEPYTSVVVGGDTLSPQLRINLDPAFGLELINNESQMTSNDNFVSYFKGLYIKVKQPENLSSGRGAVMYLSLEDALSKMVIYYSTSSESKTFTFNINSKCARFNKITTDRTGTNVDAVLNNPELGQEKYYIQSSSIRAQFDFPYIMDLQKDQKRIINKAELILPVQDFQQDVFDPTTSLFIAKIKDKYTSEFTRDYSSFVNFVSYNEADKEFRFLMTRELQSILNGDLENTGYRVYPGSFFGSSIERIIFSGANSSSKHKTRLEITYTEY